MKSFFGMMFRGYILYIVGGILLFIMFNKKLSAIMRSNYVLLFVLVFIVCVISVTVYRIKKVKELENLVPKIEEEVNYDK